MTEQELLDEIQSNAGTYEDFTARTTAIFACAKAYADAQVSAKDAEIAALKIKLSQEQIESAQFVRDLDEKDETIDALKAENARIDAAYKALVALPTLTYESDSDEVTALKADNSRMREGIQKGLIEQGGVFLNSELLALLSPADAQKDYIAHDNAFRACVEVILHSNGSINRIEHRIYALAREWAGRPLSELDRKMIDSLSPADDTYDSGKFGAPNNLDRPSTECSCSHTIDGRLVKQCDNCRNKPFVPADGDGVEEIRPKWMLNPCKECGAVDVRFLFGVNQRIQCIHCGFECSHPSSIDAAMLVWNTSAGRGIEG